ncbi:hypothetical protein N7539_000632 [Penicillium diatomitis]|uniref:Uncharacterized protein n=1 Tax=Penicillium diatomitis TaxID=2819901 RepID=A0A9W9XM11_9EURO|nr:uncharacterized protein N7539_000632 [Penicillium diatomitis]KAJ5495516.1 hypothetical protein N7539_000632 [Penicillium diatomitis]
MSGSIQKNVMLASKVSSMLGLRRAAAASPPLTRPIVGMVWQQQARTQMTKPGTIQLKVNKPADGLRELERQRLQRPVAPHLAIYKWQVHSVSSAMERNTGLLLSGGLYLFAASYMVAPWLGSDLSSATLAASFGALPVAAKLGMKFFFAWPFTFHAFNGIRYVVSSAGYTLTSKQQIVKIAWGVVASSALAAIGLVAWV